MFDNFDIWNNFKKKLNSEEKEMPYFYEREIWWCALGENIGVEINGKHRLFERPVIILKTFGRESLWIVPITSQNKVKPTYYQFELTNGEINSALLHQIRFISSKRLLRKMGKVTTLEFLQIKHLVSLFIM